MNMHHRKENRKRRQALLVAAGSLVVSSVLLAQQPAPPVDAAPIVLRVTTRLVLVDVVVKDKDGRAVTELTQEDFVLLEEGKEQEIAVFSLEEPGHLVKQEAEPPPLPPNVYTNRPEYAAPPGPLTILLLDALNTPWNDQAYVKDQMLKYLSGQLELNQRTAIFALGRELHILQSFTSDPALLRAALEQFSGEQSVELRRGEGAELAPEIASTLAQVPGQRALETLQQFNAEQAYRSVDRRVAMTLKALSIIARATAGYRGRKNLIWVSSAFPFTLAPTDFVLYRNYADQMRRTASLLTDARVAVYPADARGLVASSTFSAATSGRGPTGRALRGGAAVDQLSQESELLSSSQHTMRQLAKDTGGRAFTNRNDIDAAVKLGVADGSTYYVLGYYPKKKEWDGKFRRLEVKVARKDVDVRHRRGYFADDPTEAWKAAESSEEEAEKHTQLENVLFDPMPPTVITFLAQVLPPAPVNPATVEVRMLVDAHTLTFEPERGRQRCNLDFLVGAFSPDGKLVDKINQTVKARLRPETYQQVRQRGLPYKTALQLRPGRYLLRLIVRDNRTGLLGVTDVPLVIDAP